MHYGQPLHKRHHHCKQVALTKRLTFCFAARQQFVQGHSILVLHDEVCSSVGTEEIAARDDAGMVANRYQGAGFISEAAQPVFKTPAIRTAPGPHSGAFPKGEFDGQVLLDCYGQVQLIMAGAVDDTESAVPDDGFQGVVAQYCASR